ncbi:MAG: hypothetical protein C4341_01375 [Armatimonadota bacterium]
MTLFTAGLILYVKYGMPGWKPTPELATTQQSAPISKPPLQVQVPVAKAGKGAIEWSTTTVQGVEGEDPVVTAVNAFLASTGIVPERARLVDASYEGGVIVLNFTPEFVATYSTDDENTLLRGIFRAVHSNSNAKAIRFLAAGKQLETLGGYDLRGEQPTDLFSDK